MPSLVAEIVAEPTETPETRPELETPAKDVLLDDQITVRPVSSFPEASLVVALSWIVAPTATDPEGGLIDTLATPAGEVD